MKHIFCIFFLACFYCSLSQPFTVTASTPLDYDGASDLIPAGDGYLAIDTDLKRKLVYTYKLNSPGHSITLLKYDKNMQLVKKTKLSGGKKVYGPFLSEIKNLNGKICLFYYQPGEEKTDIDIYLAVIDPDRVEISEPRKLMSLEQKNVGYFKAINVFSDFRFIITQSPDQSKTLLFWCSGQNNKLFYAVTDSGMNILRSKVEMIAETGKFIAQNACVDNAGNVYAGFNAEKVFVGPAASDAKTLTVVPGGSGLVRQLYVAPGSGKDLVYIAGITGGIEDGNAGAFSATLNTNNFTLSATLKSAIPAGLNDTINNQLRKLYPVKRKMVDYDIFFEPIITADGRLSLLGNSTRLVTVNVRAGDIHQMRYWGSLVCVNIGTNGPVFSRIARRGMLANQGSFSFGYKDKIFILYKDDERNLANDITQDELSDKDKDGDLIVCIATIENDGSVKREAFPQKYAALTNITQLSPSTFLIPCRTGKKDIILWATLQLK